MKLIKLLAASGLALTLAGTASATTVLRIAGAATYRPPTQKAIEDILKPGYVFGYNGSSRYKPNAAIYSGTLASNSQPIIIETYWTGDLAGVVDVAKRNTIVKWIKTDSTTLANLTTSGYSVPNASLTESGIPDVGVTVSYSTSSAATVLTSGTAGRAAATAILGAHLVDAGSSSYAGGAGAVGIAAFQWVLGRQSASYTQPFTNITQQQANALITNGYIPVSLFTGTNADQSKYVFLAGRSEDAGARTVPFAEAQNGFGNPPQQYRLTFSGSGLTTQADGLVTGGTNGTVTGLYLWPGNSPLNTEPTINWNLYGHSGYNLTSDLSNALSALNPVDATSLTFGNSADSSDPTRVPDPISQVYFVGYNGVADTSTLVANGGKALSYNGVAYSPAAVKNGQYTLWSYAHIYYIGSGTYAISGSAKQAADDLADKIYTTDAPTNSSGVVGSGSGDAGILLDSSVIVARPGVEGTPVYQNY